MKPMPILLILCAVLLSACAKKEVPAPNAGHEAKLTNVSYGSHARNTMDVYLPAGRTAATPFVIVIHGGAWVAGRKEDVRQFQELLLQQGIASAAINYRFVSKTLHYDALMEDVKNAIARCASFSKAWAIRDGRYVLAGASAGAHMALLYGHQYDKDNNISGVVSLAGPTDLTDRAMLNHALAINLKEAVFNLAGAQYVPGQPIPAPFSAASPAASVKKLPTLLVHGTADEVVLYSQAEIMATKFTQQQVPHQLVTLTGEGHDLGLGKPAVLARVAYEIVNWVNKYGKQ